MAIMMFKILKYFQLNSAYLSTYTMVIDVEWAPITNSKNMSYVF